MNILHISPYLPSVKENHAGGVTMGHEIEELRKRHSVYIMTFAASDKDRELQGELDSGKSTVYPLSTADRLGNILRHLNLPLYFAARSEARFRTRMLQVIRDFKIDAVHAEYASMGQYLSVKKSYPSLQANLILHDITYQSYARKYESAGGIRKILLWCEKERVRRCENRYCHQADHVLVFNEKDAALTEQLYGIRATVINTYFDSSQADTDDSCSAAENSMCFVGQMGRPENNEAGLRLVAIAALLRMQREDFCVNIIGSLPTAELQAKENGYIHVTGFVEDISQAIRRNKIAVFPLTHGAGIKVKVLLCMAKGVPVITTAVGAEGIDETGQVLTIAETDAEFAAAVSRYFEMSPEEYKEKRRAVRSYVLEHFNWEKTVQVFDDLYGEK